MVLPVCAVNDESQGLSSVEVKCEPMFENREPEGLWGELGQNQEALQVAAAAFKEDRLGKEGSEALDADVSLLLQQLHEDVEGEELGLRELGLETSLVEWRQHI